MMQHFGCSLRVAACGKSVCALCFERKTDEGKEFLTCVALKGLIFLSGLFSFYILELPCLLTSTIPNPYLFYLKIFM